MVLVKTFVRISTLGASLVNAEWWSWTKIIDMWPFDAHCRESGILNIDTCLSLCAFALFIIWTEPFTFYNREPEMEEFDPITEKNIIQFFMAACFTPSHSAGPASQWEVWNTPPMGVFCKQQQHLFGHTWVWDSQLMIHKKGLGNLILAGVYYSGIVNLCDLKFRPKKKGISIKLLYPATKSLCFLTVTFLQVAFSSMGLTPEECCPSFQA